MLYGQRQHVALVGSHARRKFHRRDAHHRAVTDAHEIAPRRVVVRQQREDIDIDDPRADDHRPPGVVVQRVEPLLVALRRLEAQLPRRTFHLPFEILPHGAQIAAEHRDDQLHLPGVLLLTLQTDAGPLAVAQMVLQADRIASPGDLFGRKIEFARAQRDHLADEVQHAALHHHRPVGTEVLRAVAQQRARGLHAGKRLAPHDDPRIGLVVLEQDVVTRLEALYQGVFEQQGIRLAPDDDVTDGGDLADQHPHLRAVLLRLHEIGRNALAQALGLAHVDNRPAAVHELIDAGRERQQGHLLLQIGFLGCGHRRCKCNKYPAKTDRIYKNVRYFVLFIGTFYLCARNQHLSL